MLKKVSTLLLVAVFALTAISFAKVSSAKYAGKAPRGGADVEGANSVVFNVPQGERTMTFTYTTVDTMANSYGPAIVYANPIAYDPYSNTVVIVHRSKSTYATGGSGGIFYAYSTNGGSTWTKRVGPLSNGVAGNTNGRYPSISLHNPTKAASKDSVLVQAVWPLLVGGGFGGMLYASDPGVGTNSPLVGIDTAGLPWSSAMVSPTVLGDAGYVFGAMNYGDDGHVTIFRSTDGVTFTSSNPAQMANAKYVGTNVDDIAGMAYVGGVYYVGVRAQFKAAAASDTGRWTLGVSKSTDKGATWSEFEIVPWKALVPAAYDYNIYANDFNVDSDGGLHWLTVGVDTNVTPAQWSVLHLYKASGGQWTANKVRDMGVHDNWSYGALDQTLTENQLSVSTNGWVAAKWIEDGRGATYVDSLPIADVWTSSWKAGIGWSTPVNRTSTPAINDQLTHVSQYMTSDGNVHLMRNQSAANTGNGGAIDVDVTVVYHSKDRVTGVKRDDAGLAQSFTLSQNYPNPFNPSTTISFSLPSASHTTLKVYNMVGQEVATLVNDVQQAGLYFVDFNASSLASGVYFYKLQAGSFVETKKMLLVK